MVVTKYALPERPSSQPMISSAQTGICIPMSSFAFSLKTYLLQMLFLVLVVLSDAEEEGLCRV